MLGYILFISFWAVFGFAYLTRDKSKDQEQETAFFHQYFGV